MKRMLGFLLFVVCSAPLFGQTAKDVFTSESMTWYGVDFSKVKLLGSAGFSNLQEIRNYYFKAINDVIVTERKKYDLPKFFHKKTVNSNLGIVAKRNLAVNIEGLVTDDPEERTVLNAERIAAIIREYDFDNDSGLGVVLLMETLEKLDKKEGTMIVTFFDISSKSVLFSERMVGSAGGFGFRNYWVSTVFRVLKDIYDDNYSVWNDTYNK